MAENRSNGWWKWTVIFSAIVAVAAGGVWFFKRGSDDTPQYQTATVGRGDLTQAVTATGTLNPVVNVTVGSQISGRISKLFVDFNSIVKSNQVIAQIDDSTYQANLERAEADLASTVAGAELARVEAERSSQLFTNKLISQSDYDTASASLHQAQSAVQIKQAALNSARVDLSRCTIYSPVDGTVISRNVDIGQTVAASLSSPVLFQIANDLAKMQIDSNVSEADIGSIEEGQNISFLVDAFPDRKFTGKIKQIRNSPTTVQNVVTYDVVIEVGNPDLKLRPGMTANASIITAERSGVLKIPNAALRFRPPETAANKETKPAATNVTQVAKTGDTNRIDVAAGAAPPLTGNEPPEELQKRVSEMRARGEEIPAAIRTKLRELYQSGALQRPAGQGGARGGGGGGSGSRGSQSSSRTVYIPVADKNSGNPAPQAVRVKTGISDGAYTEVTDGLKEGDIIITGVKFQQAAVAAPPGGASPFGGGGGGGFRGGGR
jgi:HlyD family secretion protein